VEPRVDLPQVNGELRAGLPDRDLRRAVPRRIPPPVDRRLRTPTFSATKMMPSGSSCARRGLGSLPMMENLVNNDGTASP